MSDRDDPSGIPDSRLVHAFIYKEICKSIRYSSNDMLISLELPNAYVYDGSRLIQTQT